MASSSLSMCIRCGGDRNVLDRRVWDDHWNHNARRPCSLAIRGSEQIGRRTSMAMAVAKTSVLNKLEPRRKCSNNAIAREDMDQWLRDSVTDIVKNLREAPLFVHVYKGGGGGTTRMKTEKAVEENWTVTKEKWERGEAPSPEGVILVEELEKETEEEGVTKAWGIVVQGRGLDCGPACYLLKTSRVGSGSGSGSGSGLGMWCTHFCLVRVKGFREKTHSQLKNCWLLQGEGQ